jgi:hypothetical protein
MRDSIEKFIIQISIFLFGCKKCGLKKGVHKMSCKDITLKKY